MINLKKNGRRIEIRSDEPLPGMRTTIPGAYETVGGYWTVPLSLESLKLLRQKFGKRLKLETELSRWAQGIVESRRYMAGVAASDDAELDHLARAAPKLARAMRKRTYQRVGVRFVADSSAALIADDPGLGKTLIAMGGILEAEIPGPYLVVAPKTAADTVWRREIMRWLPMAHRAIILPQVRDQREYRIRITRYTAETWLIVHPEILLVQSWWQCQERVKRKRPKSGMSHFEVCGRKTIEGNSQQRMLDCGHARDRKTKKVVAPNYPKLFEIQWGAIIVDESHECLIRRKGVPTQRRRGLDMLSKRPDGIKLAMSGTPFDSKPHQLWGTLNWLDPVTYSAFHRWAELYWQKGGYTGFEIGEFRKDREAMLWDSLKAITIRRTKAEVAKDLPPKMHVGSRLVPADSHSPIGIWLEMDDAQERAYRQMEETSVAELETGRIEAITALAELTRLKQMACAYGNIETKLVKASCYKRVSTKTRGQYSPICDECKAQGYHKELKHLYTPHLPSNKFNWIVESLEEWGYPKNPITKVVIVSFYTGILEMMRAGIEKHFKRKDENQLCTAITGRVPSNDRRQIIDRFNNDDRGTPQIMMLNVKAGGTAITIDSADRMIFISETRNPAQQWQAEDRIHRVSNPRQCMYYYLRSLNSVDVGTSLVNQEADRETRRLLDARRGVEYVQHVLELSRSFS